MILEGLVSLACLYGHTEACMTGLHNYAKHYKLDEKAQVVERKVKSQYPAAHFMGATAGMLIQKKYTFLIYKNYWFNGDYSDNFNQKTLLVYKYEF